MAVRQDEITDAVRAAVGLLEGQVDVAAAYLFGSQLHGEPHEFSDIDLAIFTSDADRLGLLGRMRLGARLQRECGDDLEPHFFPARVLKNPPPGSFAEHVIKTGKRVI